MTAVSSPASIGDVIANDLCIGCGLCESVTGGRVTMTLTAKGSLRPTTTDFRHDEEAILAAACPGLVAEARPEPSFDVDPVWGAHGTMAHAWAGDPDVRFKSATGGVLTALGVHLLTTGQVRFVLHVGADPDQPMRSRTVLSETAESMIENTGSRYGPTSPLDRLHEALDRDQPFAVVAKPCDLGAIHRLSRVDDRVDRLCTFRLAMVCGGQSKLTKSQLLLDESGFAEERLTTFRYRGYGNPGPTVLETIDGARFETTYRELWEDESSWDLETRCKLCPDALGETADVSAADVWPGGGPEGEDEGFNGVIVRSLRGEALLDAAFLSGDLTRGTDISPDQFNDFQPHQVRKKHALRSRYQGMTDAGVEPIDAIGLRIEKLGAHLSPTEAEAHRTGTATRMDRIRQDQGPTA